MQKVKQVIVFRKDIYKKIRGGKFGAQCGHAGSISVLQFLKPVTHDNFPQLFIDMGDGQMEPAVKKGEKMLVMKYQDDSAIDSWINGKFTKIVVSCETEDELKQIHERAGELEIASEIITDAGITEFKEPTITCVSIGPDYSEVIDEITGHLPTL